MRFFNCNFRPCNAGLSRRDYYLCNSPNWWENHYFSTPFHSQLIPNHNVIQATKHAHIFLGFCLRSGPIKWFASVSVGFISSTCIRRLPARGGAADNR